MTGRIDRGIIRPMEEVSIVGIHPTSTTVVTGVEMFRKSMDEAIAGDNIGLLLRKLSGWGKPRQAQGRKNAVIALLCTVFAIPSAFRAARSWATRFSEQTCRGIMAPPGAKPFPNRLVSATAC